jgi:hypothetical protein
MNYPGVLYDASKDGGGGGGEGGEGGESPAVASPRKNRKVNAIDMFEPAPSAPEGGESGEGGTPRSNEKSPMRESRDNVKEISKQMSGEEKTKEKAISYFEEDEGDEAPEGGEPTGEEGGEIPEGSEPPEGDTDQFYLPDVHAKDKDVYPNSYKTRPDAEYAVANKLSKYEEYANELNEMDSEVGSTIPAQIQQQIEQYGDITQLEGLEDGELRDFIVNLDMSLKGLDEKVSRVKQTFNTSQRITESEKNLNEAKATAQEVVKEINLAPRLSELSENAEFEELLTLADEQFEKVVLQPINERISEHEKNTELIKNNHDAWLNKLRDLEKERTNARNDIQEKRQKLVKWNDARIEAEEAKKETQKSQPLSRTERIQRSDKIFKSWMEDRSTGPFALDVFKAETTEPVAHLRKYAFAPKNFEKFDLTTKAGWDQLHEDWKSTMNQRFAETKGTQSEPKSRSRKESQVSEPIPEPERKRDNPSVRRGSKLKQMQESRNAIKKASKQLYR